MKIKINPNKTLYRSVTIPAETIDLEGRRCQLAFSSETPVERAFGQEILSHRSEDVDLQFMGSGTAPLLNEHRPEDQIGVVEQAGIDGGVGRAVVRFSRSPAGAQAWQDVVDGIKRNVSVGYQITGTKVERSASGDQVVTCSWKPLEISLVSIPADMTVGVGRSKDEEPDDDEDEEDKERSAVDPDHDGDEDHEDDPAEGDTDDDAPVKPTPKRSSTMTTEQKTVDVEVVRSEAQKQERARTTAIQELAARHNANDLAGKFIADGKSLDEFRAALLDNLGSRQQTVSNFAPIGLSDKEVKQFSLGRAVKAMVSGDWSEAGFELEASKAVAKQLGRSQGRDNIFVPADYWSQRDASAAAQSVGGTNVGSQLVATNLRPDMFVDVLFNNSIAKALGVTTMSGLVGNIDIPRFTSKVAAYEVAEGVDITEGTVSTAKIHMAPRQFGALVEFTRTMAIQSTPNIEAVLRAHLVKKLSEKLDQIVFSKLLGETNINWVTSGGTISWANIQKAINTLELQNALNDNCRWALNPHAANQARTTLKASVAGVNNTMALMLLDEANKMGGYDVLVSNNVPVTATSGTPPTYTVPAIFGDFAEVVVGSWSSLELALDVSQRFASGGYLLRCITDMDVGVVRDESFTGFTDLVAS